MLDTSAPVPVLGKHGFVGYEGHATEHMSAWADKTEFSLGVFEWVSMARGPGAKPGPVKIRVKGLFTHAPAVYAKAREICQRLDAGESILQKSFSI